MSIKGYPSNKKDVAISGRSNEFATVIPTDPYRNALDVPRFAFRVDNDTVPRTATADTGLESTQMGQIFWIGDTATPAKVGDIVRFQNGNAQYIEFPILKIETNRFAISCIPNQENIPASGDLFYIMRYTTQRVDETGSQIVISQPGPTQFVLDGNDVEVEEDTVDPANNKPLPTKLFDSANLPINPATEETLGAISGKLPATLGQKSMAASLAVTLASDQSPVPTKPASTSGATFSFNGLGQNAELTNLDGQETWDIYVSAFGVGGAVMVFGSPDPTSVALQSIPAVNLRTGETSITINDVGLYRVNIAGFSKVRLEVTAYGTNPIAGIQLVSYNSSVVSLASPLPTGTNTIGAVTQGAAPWSVSQSGTWNINDISGTISLPTGAATEATLSGLNDKFGSLGQKAMAGSAPVVIASDQSTLPISAASLPLPAGAAAEATLSAMSAKLPATLGQKTSANSMAVVIASDQSAIPVSPSAGASGDSPGSSTVSTVATITAPANALGFILMNLDTSTTNMRYRIGAVATTTSGQQLQPGRDTGYIPCGANISIVAESGTVAYDIQWVVR